jgi:TatD DNase family protein
MYIDIHSHTSQSASDIIVVRNLFPEDSSFTNNNEYYSVGYHPWYIIEDKIDEELNVLEKFAAQKCVVAIGECGFDKFSNATNQLQKLVFIKQLKIAANINKPLIIHCVGAFNELSRIAVQSKPAIPFIVHGFRGNPQLAKQLIKHGFYVSIGNAVAKNTQLLTSLLACIPLSKLFIETDESGADIRDIYSTVAHQLNFSIEELCDIQNNNFSQVFKIH